jgi:hypothetical protein
LQPRQRPLGHANTREQKRIISIFAVKKRTIRMFNVGAILSILREASAIIWQPVFLAWDFGTSACKPAISPGASAQA